MRLTTLLACVGLTVTVGCKDDDGAKQKKPAPAEQSEAESRDDAGAAATVQPGLTVDFLRAQIRTLADDAMGGRQPGTPGAKRAVAHIIETMDRIGLQPAGENDGWTQTVPMRAVRTKSNATELKWVGQNEEHALNFGDDYVASTYGPAGDHEISAPLVFMGYGVTAPEQEWDDYGDLDLEGKIAVVFVGDPPVENRFADEALTYYGRWTYKFERALEAGAAGCLVIHETEPASYGWNVVQNSWSGERFHVVEPGGGLPEALQVRGWLSKEAAQTLAEHAGSSLERWHEMALDPDFDPVETSITLRGELVTEDRTLSDVNVLGRLPGTSKSDQAVMITAHWDHLGTTDDPEAKDRIFNGAVDNASGIAAMLGIAAELRQRKQPLERSVLFLATTAEEQGLLGSRYFANNPTMPVDKIAGVVNLDSMNVHGETKTIQVVGMGQTSLEDTLAEIAKRQGRKLVPDERPEAGGYYRSDHFSLAKVGVPAIYFRGGKDMKKGGVEAGEKLAKRNAEHYHTVSDEFDPSWSLKGALQDAHAAAALVAEIATAESLPTWKPSSEFAELR